MSTEETIKDIVIRIVRCEGKEITHSTTWDDMRADSLDVVQVLSALEDTFDIEISDEQAKGLNSFGDLVEHVEDCLKEA